MAARFAVRSIGGTEIKTPLVIPAFSSCNAGFQPVHCRDLRPYLPPVVCFSAYDLHHGHVTAEDTHASSVLFLDSGGYEMRFCGAPASADAWTHALHEGTIRKLSRQSGLVLVSFDPPSPGDLEAQCTSGARLLDSFSGIPVEIALHLSANEFSELLGNVKTIARFAIVGLPEEELGGSVLERCRNIRTLRDRLAEAGLELPIHILGCLEPAKVLAYFLCGADIFDGLSWQRQAILNGIGVTTAAATITAAEWRVRDRELAFAWAARNLQYLERLRLGMAHAGVAGRAEGLEEVSPQLDRVLELVREADA